MTDIFGTVERAAMESSQKYTPWSNNEVQTFLSITGDKKPKKKQKTFVDVAKWVPGTEYNRTSRQCQEKFKRLKSEYKNVKGPQRAERVQSKAVAVV